MIIIATCDFERPGNEYFRERTKKQNKKSPAYQGLAQV